MARYVRRPPPRADEHRDDRVMPPLAHPMVFESEAVKTGLVDQNGYDLCRLPDEIGFLRREKDVR